MRRNCTVAVVFCLLLASPAAAQATTFTVDRSSDDVADGDCSVPAGPCTLRGAVERANDAPGPDRIVVGDRTVTLTQTDLDIDDDLTIAGGVIDGSGMTDRIIDANADLVLEGVRLTGGQDGAVRSDGARLEILGSRIDSNEGDDTIVELNPEEGAATLILRDSAVEGNEVGAGDSGLPAIVQFDPDDTGGTLIVERSTLTGNRIDGERDSGGVLDFQPDGDQEDTATVRISDSAVTDNTVGSQGVGGLRIAPFNVGTVDVQVARSRFERNVGAGGIGFYPQERQEAFTAASRAEEGAATLVVTDSTFDGNVAGQGGAIDISPGFSVDSGVTVARSTFVGNRARGNGEDRALGGAINIWRGALTVENSTFTGNSVEDDAWSSGGGAIAANGSSILTLKHVTIAGNRAEGGARGGGIHGPILDSAALRVGARSFVPITVTNSIVAGNTSEPQLELQARTSALAPEADNCDFAVGTGGGNLESADTCGFNDASDKRNTDPKLAALAANGGPTRTMAIAPGSPAIDAAGATACLAGDQRGVARTAASCDSGAYEYVAATPQPTSNQPAVVQPAAAGRTDCLSVRRFKIRLRVPHGEVVRKATVLVNGKKVKVKRGKRLTAVIDLRGLPKKRYRVEITLKLKGGETISGVRRYWTCTPAIRWTKPPKV